MELSLKPANKLTYKFRLTPQMQLAFHLLQMPLVKLKELIKKEAEENPLLNIENIKPPRDANYRLSEEEMNYRESLLTKAPTLAEYLLRQLELSAESDDEREVGVTIIGSINEAGYLEGSIEDLVKSTSYQPAIVEKVLNLIQTFDPSGVGARDLRECLLIQLKSKGKGELGLACRIVDKYLPYLKDKRYAHIAKKLSNKGGKVSVEMIKDAIKELAGLEPKPGRSFNTEEAVYLIPDAILKKGEKGYEAIFNEWELPRITLNAKYKNMLKQAGTPEDAKAYLKERIQAARTLINAIQRRNETIQKVIEEIVSIQRESFDHEEIDLKPMTLEQIGKRIGKHKSTVSRAVVSKYIQTPRGIVELRSFFGSGVRQVNGGLMSSGAIKTKIRDLIESEEQEGPITDQGIADSLKKGGISVARRTVAKYRGQLKILSSKSR
jgi:RNA polymerase sigma-54 factor